MSKLAIGVVASLLAGSTTRLIQPDVVTTPARAAMPLRRQERLSAQRTTPTLMPSPTITTR